MSIQQLHTDEELIQRALSGEERAFRLLVERYQQQVRTTVFGMMGDSAEAAEVAQDVFIRFYKKMNQFKGESSLATYLTRIAINLSLTALKKRQRRQARQVALDQSDGQLQIEDQGNDPRRQEARDTIQRALQRLDPEFRTVVVLRLIEGYSIEETAQLLDIPPGTVSSRLNRAQLKLKSIIQRI